MPELFRKLEFFQRGRYPNPVARPPQIAPLPTNIRADGVAASAAAWTRDHHRVQEVQLKSRIEKKKKAFLARRFKAGMDSQKIIAVMRANIQQLI